MRATATVSVAAILVAVLTSAALLHAQQGAPEGAWPAYGGDAGSTKYAPLDRTAGAWPSSVDPSTLLRSIPTTGSSPSVVRLPPPIASPRPAQRAR